MRSIVLTAAFGLLFLAPRPAHAGEGKKKIFEGSAGALITAGGNIWTQPEFDFYGFDLEDFGTPLGDTWQIRSATYTASQTMDLRLMIGLTYDF